MTHLSPTEAINQIFSEKGRFQRWLDVEASLARVQASLSLVPKEAADAISRKANAELLDLKRYKEMYQQTGHPMVAMLRLFQPIIEGGYGQYVHFGATTQDIMDTAMMLALKKAHEIIYASLRRIELDLLNMAEQHADTLMVGRTHAVQALPITFGYKVAIWAREIRRNVQRLKECQNRIFVAQLCGAVGTMAAFGPKGPEIQSLVAKDLGLGDSDISWHASRDRLAEFANLLALIGGALGRIGQEVYLLMATEVGEVCEPWQKGVVGSSTMPHKVNPQIAQTMRDLARKLRYNASFITEVMMVDHERNLDHFLGEREKMEESCLIMGELLTFGEDMAKNMTVDPGRMKTNLGLLKGLLLSESVMIELGKKIGKQSAHEVIYEDAMKSMKEGVDFKQALLEDPRVSRHLTSTEIDRLLNPEEYIGLAPRMAREMVALSRKEREGD
ncbi:MAG TPA: adenylosuccinate lyase [Thermodesulfobacteriota bacterium]|nr:adenylosuccinate lyase [Thermodesulfobacteriota bacterium]